MSDPFRSEGYSADEAASVVGLTRDQLQAFVEAGLVRPTLSAEGPPRFSFRDLSVLRSAKVIAGKRVPRRQLLRALRQWQAQLPGSASATPVGLEAEGGTVVVKDSFGRWSADSGQGLLDLGRPSEVTPFPTHQPGAERLYDQACALEESNPLQAIAVYRESLTANPRHADAHVNLGRLLHLAGNVEEAADQYRLALEARPEDPTATFNLAIAQEDLGQLDEAIATYTQALELDPGLVDAYFNLARIYEQKGEKMAAIRHLKDYRRLARQE